MHDRVGHAKSHEQGALFGQEEQFQPLRVEVTHIERLDELDKLVDVGIVVRRRIVRHWIAEVQQEGQPCIEGKKLRREDNRIAILSEKGQPGWIESCRRIVLVTEMTVRAEG